MALLDIENLTVEFQTSSGLFRAVDGVSLTCDKGEILSIVGESGSGKSVSMLAMMGLLPWTAKITADRMMFDGKDLRGISARQRRRIIGEPQENVLAQRLAEEARHLCRVCCARRHQGGGQIVHDLVVPADLARLPGQQPE